MDYDPSFRLYLVTGLANPHFPPQVCIATSVINFMVTHEGLEDQLLGMVVESERPELEDQKKALTQEIVDANKQLKELEDEILRLLGEASGNILDDEVHFPLGSSSLYLHSYL